MCRQFWKTPKLQTKAWVLGAFFPFRLKKIFIITNISYRYIVCNLSLLARCRPMDGCLSNLYFTPSTFKLIPRLPVQKEITTICNMDPTTLSVNGVIWWECVSKTTDVLVNDITNSLNRRCIYVNASEKTVLRKIIWSLHFVWLNDT